jgi:hypothetical protein
MIRREDRREIEEPITRRTAQFGKPGINQGRYDVLGHLLRPGLAELLRQPFPTLSSQEAVPK